MYEVCGFDRSQFTAQDTGQQLSGWNIYLQWEHPKTTGFRCKKIYLHDGKCDYVPQLGDKVNVYYNEYKKVDAVQRV